MGQFPSSTNWRVVFAVLIRKAKCFWLNFLILFVSSKKKEKIAMELTEISKYQSSNLLYCFIWFVKFFKVFKKLLELDCQTSFNCYCKSYRWKFLITFFWIFSQKCNFLHWLKQVNDYFFINMKLFCPYLTTNYKKQKKNHITNK